MNTVITVTINTATNRWSTTTSSNTTIRAFLEEQDIKYANCTVHLDGMPLTSAALDSTFEAQGVTETCMLAAIVKAANA